MKITQDAITRFAVVPLALPQAWTQLRFADEQVCEAITRRSGFEAPTFKRLPIVWKSASVEQLVNPLEKMSIRTKMIVESQPLSVQKQMHEYILAEVEAQRANGMICLAWPALLSVVSKPRHGVTDVKP